MRNGILKLIIAIGIIGQATSALSEEVSKGEPAAFKQTIPLNSDGSAHIDIEAKKVETTSEIMEALINHPQIETLQIYSGDKELKETQNMIDILEQRFPKRNFDLVIIEDVPETEESLKRNERSFNLVLAQGIAPKEKKSPPSQADKALGVIGGSFKGGAAFIGILIKEGGLFPAIASATYQLTVNYLNIAYREKIDSIMTSNWVSFTTKSDLKGINVDLWVDQSEIKLSSKNFKGHLQALFKDIIENYSDLKVLHIATSPEQVSRIQAESDQLINEFNARNTGRPLKIKVIEQKVFNNPKKLGVFSVWIRKSMYGAKVWSRNFAFNGSKMFGTVWLKEILMPLSVAPGSSIFASIGVTQFIFILILNQSLNALSNSVRQVAADRQLLTKLGSCWGFFYKMAITQPIVIMKLLGVEGAEITTFNLELIPGVRVPIVFDSLMLMIPVSFALITAHTYFMYDQLNRWGKKSQKFLDDVILRWYNERVPKLKAKFKTPIHAPAGTCHMVFQ